jgi:hypothetical protein
MKITSIASLAAILALPLIQSGCASISGQAQGALDATSQAALGAVINNSPQDFNGFVAAYPLLYSIPAGSMDSYQLGQALTQVRGGPSSKGVSDLANALDGITRNLIAQQSGGTGVTSLTQATIEQITGVIADGYWHALNNFAGAHNLPRVPQIVTTTTTVPVAAPAAVKPTS